MVIKAKTIAAGACNLFFGTFRLRQLLHGYDVRLSSATLYGERKHRNKTIWNWEKVLRTKLQEKSPTFYK